MYLKETQLLLDELGAKNHRSVPDLREARAIDGFLTGEMSATEAAGFARISADQFRALLQRRGISHLLDGARPRDVNDKPEISVVLPVFNEQDNIEEIHRRLVNVLQSVSSFELIFVNNGSYDDSGARISEIQGSDPHVKLVDLSRNFGHQGALTAGIDQSLGRAIVLMDADLQDPPEVLEEMIARWHEGAEVVYAVRQKRKDNVLKRAAYFAFYRFLRRCSDIEMPLDSGDFCLMDRVVVDHLKALPEKSRFLRGLRAWVGFKQVPLYYERAERHAGESKYQFRHLFRFALEGLVSFSSMPLRLAVYCGFLVSLSGIGYLAFALVSRLINSQLPAGWTSTVALILLLGGTQLILLGVLGEYIARIYDEAKKRPTYIIKSISVPGNDLEKH
jgi:dolichol-phosphate mannosyltransferase